MTSWEPVHLMDPETHETLCGLPCDPDAYPYRPYAMVGGDLEHTARCSFCLTRTIRGKLARDALQLAFKVLKHEPGES